MAGPNKMRTSHQPRSYEIRAYRFYGVVPRTGNSRLRLSIIRPKKLELKILLVVFGAIAYFIL